MSGLILIGIASHLSFVFIHSFVDSFRLIACCYKHCAIFNQLVRSSQRPPSTVRNIKIINKEEKTIQNICTILNAIFNLFI